VSLVVPQNWSCSTAEFQQALWKISGKIWTTYSQERGLHVEGPFHGLLDCGDWIPLWRHL
jgi:hypothetical protein